MTQATFIDTTIDLTEEEEALALSRAKYFSLELADFARVCALTGGLPDAGPFIELTRRLARFGNEYEACVQAIAGRRGDYLGRIALLETNWLQLSAELLVALGYAPEDGEPARLT
jgi:hypothetical protein